jgi:hypothetical protein
MMPRSPIKPAQFDPFDLTTRVFPSYRREDSSTAVQHLRESLGRLIGEDKILRALEEDYRRREPIDMVDGGALQSR